MLDLQEAVPSCTGPAKVSFRHNKPIGHNHIVCNTLIHFQCNKRLLLPLKQPPVVHRREPDRRQLRLGMLPCPIDPIAFARLVDLS